MGDDGNNYYQCLFKLNQKLEMFASFLIQNKHLFPRSSNLKCTCITSFGRRIRRVKSIRKVPDVGVLSAFFLISKDPRKKAQGFVVFFSPCSVLGDYLVGWAVNSLPWIR